MKLENFKSPENSIIIDLKKGVVIFRDVEEKDKPLHLQPIVHDGENTCYYASVDFAKDNDKLYYSHERGIYFIRETMGNPKAEEHKPTKCYPYRLGREYGADKSLKSFQKVFDALHKDSKAKVEFKPIPYTFGIEYETSCGVIPEYECYRSGLIPLRDGSITGNEYASVVMSERTIYAIDDQIAALKKYTDYDKDCAIHIHFGGIPLELNFMYILSILLKRLETEVVGIAYRDVFNTERYKTTGKSYCMPLYTTKSSFRFYEQQSCGMPFFGSLYEDHPSDESGEHKWQIKTRYHWCNFINGMFYDRGKTVEFRHFRPTFNRNVYLANIHLYTAILEYAEELYQRSAHLCDDLKYEEVLNFIVEEDKIKTLEDIVDHVDRSYLKPVLMQMRAVSEKRLKISDYSSSNKDIDGMIKSFMKLINKKVKNATIVEYDGIKFRSKLELSAYKLFTEAGLAFEYEPTKISLWEGFKLEKVKYIRPKRISVGKYDKELSEQTTKFINMTYTPDFKFVINNTVIYMDVKGNVNDLYPYKVKMFLKHLESLDDCNTYIFMEPHSVRQIKACIELIKKEYEK